MQSTAYHANLEKHVQMVSRMKSGGFKMNNFALIFRWHSVPVTAHGVSRTTPLVVSTAVKALKMRQSLLLFWQKLYLRIP